MREMFRSKIHRATVTHANLAYEGSVTIDDDLLKAADILEFEKVHVWNVTRGDAAGHLCHAGRARQRRYLHQWCGGASRQSGRFGHYCDIRPIL